MKIINKWIINKFHTGEGDKSGNASKPSLRCERVSEVIF